MLPSSSSQSHSSLSSMNVSSTGCHTVVSAGYPDPVDRRSGPPSPPPHVGPTMFSDGSHPFVQAHPFFNRSHRGRQNVTCSLYTPLHYRRRGQGSSAALHWWSTLAVGSHYHVGCDRAYHGVIAIGHW